MINWRLVKEDRVDIVKNIYKGYIEHGTPDRDSCDDWCVTLSCKESEFNDSMNKKCLSANFSCVDCWKEFFKFLDIKTKRSNMEVYENE